MAEKVLVVYGSKYGATAGIAEKIGAILREEGLQVDVLQADHTGDLTQYDAFVIGSAVYMGQWRKEVSSIIKNNEKLFVGKPVWLFSSGPVEEGDPVKLAEGWSLPKSLQPVTDRIKPRDITIFHGAIDVNKLNFLEKLIGRMLKITVADYRDWDAITNWTKNIAGELKK
ncbi:flavodoxin domain-containing protein [Chloroflexota bacterium]